MRERQVVGSDGRTYAVRHHYHRPPSQWQRVRVRRWSGPLSDRDIQAWQGHSPLVMVSPTSLTVASSPLSDLSQATVDRAWAYATPPASEILGQVVT